MRIIKFLLCVGVVSLSSCAELMLLSQQFIETSAPLSQSEISAGLKEALVVGAGKSADILGVTDGYYKDDLVKILLPPETDIIIENINKIPGGSILVEDVLMKINRSAEDAAKEVKPIFLKAVTSMSITDAVSILNGDDDAATLYLKNTTSQELIELYRPYIAASLDKKLFGDVSTQDSWDQLTGGWNTIANSIVGQLTGYQPVDVALDDYLTQKALDGLFLKISDQEKQIREDPIARVNDLLKRVFGSLD